MKVINSTEIKTTTTEQVAMKIIELSQLDPEEIYTTLKNGLTIFTFHFSDKLFQERLTQYFNFIKANAGKKLCFMGDMNGCVSLNNNTLYLHNKSDNKIIAQFEVPEGVVVTDSTPTCSKMRVFTAQYVPGKDKFGDNVTRPIDGGVMSTPIDAEDVYVVTSHGIFRFGEQGTFLSLFDHFLKFVRTSDTNIGSLNVGNMCKLYYEDNKIMPYGEMLFPNDFASPEKLKQVMKDLATKHRDMPFPLVELKTNIPSKYHELLDQMFSDVKTYQQMISKHPKSMGDAGQNSQPAQEGNYDKRNLSFGLSELLEMSQEDRVAYVGVKSKEWSDTKFVEWYIWVTLQLKFFNDLTTIKEVKEPLERKFTALQEEETNVLPLIKIIDNIITGLQLDVLCLQEVDNEKFTQITNEFTEWECIPSLSKDGVFSVIMKKCDI